MGEEVIDSPVGWVAKHINSYVDSWGPGAPGGDRAMESDSADGTGAISSGQREGKSGHRYYGVDALLLTTRGRKSGKLRRTALYYGNRGDDLVIVASNGGSVGHPFWYRNLSAEPTVTVQVKGDVFTATARTATGQERAELWKLMSGLFPTYDGYQAKVEREIPVVVLSRSA